MEYLKSLHNLTKMKYFWFYLALVIVLISITIYFLYTTTSNKPTYVENKEFVNKDSPNQLGETENEAIDIYFFHTSWCPHCKTAFPIWNELKSDLPMINGNKINYIEVDCEKDSATAEKFLVTGYPTIKMVRGNKEIEYDAKPDLETLIRFVKTSV